MTPSNRSLFPVLLASLASVLFANSSGAAESVNGLIAYTACSYDSDLGRQTCDIWVTDPETVGAEPKNITNTPEVDETDPSWSPDGSQIAYTLDLGACNTNIWVMASNGSRKRQVTYRDQPDTYACQLEPTWGPGGEELAFLRTNPVSFLDELVIINVDSGVERVVPSPGGPGTGIGALEIAWSPDGGKFAFAAVRQEMMEDPITGEPVVAAQYEIVTINVDGSGEQVISAGLPGTRRVATLEEDRAPEWSPDGSRLVFMSQSQDPSCCGPWQLWMASRDGTTIENISPDPAIDDMGPSWSPDGSKILFSRAVGGRSDLYAMPAPPAVSGLSSSAHLRAVTLEPLTAVGDVSDASWGPRRRRGGATKTLAVTTGGTGQGVVSSVPTGMECSSPDRCRTRFPAGATVTLTATASPGSEFAGWKGRSCRREPTPICTLTMDDPQMVRALFR